MSGRGAGLGSTTMALGAVQATMVTATAAMAGGVILGSLASDRAERSATSRTEAGMVGSMAGVSLAFAGIAGGGVLGATLGSRIGSSNAFLRVGGGAIGALLGATAGAALLMGGYEAGRSFGRD